jgi:hypothetical protein
MNSSPSVTATVDDFATKMMRAFAQARMPNLSAPLATSVLLSRSGIGEEWRLVARALVEAGNPLNQKLEVKRLLSYGIPSVS